MSRETQIPPQLLIELARQRGWALEPQRASALRPLLESLLRGLALVAERLPPEAPPAPGGLSGSLV
ncbi:MAG TPA: hypothetical protein VGK93_03210 [Candidatus Eisenbacteria bacterium]